MRAFFVILLCIWLTLVTAGAEEDALSAEWEVIESEIILAIKEKMLEKSNKEKCKLPNPFDLNVDSIDTMSPYEVNMCQETETPERERKCDQFDYSLCTKECVVGYVEDANGCITSCDCRKEGLLESDIKLDVDDVNLLSSAYRNEDRSYRAAGRFTRRWNNKPTDDGTFVIPYILDSTITANPKAVAAISAAMAQYTKQTCLRFEPRTVEGDYLRYFAGRGCYSYLGRRGGKQPISIGRGCEMKGIVMHEMMHAMGFWHEHSRPDRDTVVKINFENVHPRMRGNFRKVPPFLIDSMGSPYDMGSIMQYGGFFFSINRKPTIVDLKTGKPIVSQRNAFTSEDVKQLNTMYHCDNYLQPDGNDGEE